MWLLTFERFTLHHNCFSQSSVMGNSLARGVSGGEFLFGEAVVIAPLLLWLLQPN